MSPQSRYIDIACQFEVWRRPPGETEAQPTAKRSRVYGGRYDTWARELVGPATTENIALYPCSDKQFDLVVADVPRIEGNGGRGSGKSEGGVLRVLRFICERPNEAGQCVSPTFDLTHVIWFKLLSQLPGDWLLPGKEGIRRGERRLVFVNGVDVRFRSADNPDSLRSWGGGWTFVDEEQDVGTEAFNIVWPSLRKSANPCLWSVGTPKSGEYRDRHDKLQNDADAVIFEFNSYSNPFISHRAFELAKEQMTEQMYRQEILAKWDDLDEAYVCRREFNPAVHGMAMPPPPMQGWHDITSKLMDGKRYIAGVDYQLGPPNVAWVYRVFAGSPRRWVLVAIVKAPGEASNLAQALNERGFTGDNTAVIDDASGEYNRYGGKRKANSSARLMRQCGFRCIHPKKNPLIKDRVNALLVKLKPLEGSPSWFYDIKLEAAVKEVMTQVRWKGNELSKDEGVDHDFDAATYPLHFFEPPARLQIPSPHGTDV